PDDIAKAVICAPVKVGTRKRRMSSIGALERSSIATKAARSTAAAVKRPTMRPLDQPQSEPRKSPSTRANSAPVQVTSPGTSAPPCSSLRDSCSSRRPAATQTIPIGMLTKKIQRQPTYVVSAPPTSGPIATASPPVAERAGVEHRRGQGERVRVHDPLQIGEGGAQLLVDLRQRDVDYRDVEEQHEDRHAHHDQDAPFPLHQSRSIRGKLIEEESSTTLRKVSRDGAHAVTRASASADGG